jgi:hypothetical protein
LQIPDDPLGPKTSIRESSSSDCRQRCQDALG